MDLKIGEVIASLRREKGITQEQFATEVGVSVPAVSKWETGQSYPDITMLPVIAEFFNVTIDALMNLSLKDINHKQSDTIMQLSNFVYNHDFDNGLKLAFEAAKKYPNDFYIMMYTANLLSFRGHSDKSSINEKDLRDSISYYEAAIKLCKDNKMMINLNKQTALLYMDLGEYDHAINTLEDLEIEYVFAIEIADLKFRMGDVKGSKKLLQEKLNTDIFHFSQLCNNLMECYSKENNNTMVLETQKLHCGVLEMMTGDVPNYYDNILVFAYGDLGKLYMADKNYSKMWNALEKAVYHASRFDKNPSSNHKDVKFYDEIKHGGFSMNHLHNCSTMLLNLLHSEFTQFSGDERYKKLTCELEITAVATH